MENDFYKKIYKLIENNLEKEDFSVEDLASQSGLSRSMLHRKLKKVCGISATELITEIRLDKAKELLAQNEFTAAEIAYKVGFNSPSYFNKVFRKHYQVSPGEIRKGKKVEPDRQNNKKESQKNIYKTPILITSIILTVFVLVVSGIHVFNGKENRADQSIAILPFDNLSTIENTQYFADGVVEDLLTRLSRIEGLKVISRTSSEMFREKGDKTVPEIGKLLDVGYILEGSVQREKDDIRISIQLINSETDDHVLSKQYDRSLNEIFKVQREIAREIASEIAPVLTSQQLEQIGQDYTQNTKAFELYQLGRLHSSKRTVGGYRKGIEYYEKAIEMDSLYALAYAGLADNYFLMAIQGHVSRAAGKKKALENAGRASEINPNLAEIYTVLGGIYTFIDRNWEEAEKEFQKAIRLNPNYSTAQQYYAEYLKIIGQEDKAREHLNIALILDPFSYVVHQLSSRFYYDNEQFEEAKDEIKIALDLNKDHLWSLKLGYAINLASNDYPAVLECTRRVGILTNLWKPEEVDSVYQKGGIEGLIRFQMNLNNGPEYHRAVFYAMLGEYEKSMDLLEMAWVAGQLPPSRTTYREYKPLRLNPRFKAIRKEMGLPQLEP